MANQGGNISVPVHVADALLDAVMRGYGRSSSHALLPSVGTAPKSETAAPVDTAGLLPAVGGGRAPVAPGATMTSPSGTPSVPPSVQSPLDRQIAGMEQKVAGDEAPPSPHWGQPGSAHPGKMGEFLHVLGRVGDVAGSIVAPGAMMQIPGTTLNKDVRNMADFRRLQGLERLRGQRGEETLKGAQAANFAETTKEMGAEKKSTEEYQSAEAYKALHPEATTPEIGTYRSLTNMGMSPTDALKEIERDKQLALKPPNMQAKTLVLPSGEQVAGKSDSQGNLLLADNTPAPKGAKLYVPLNYGAEVLPSKTATFIDANTGMPTLVQYDPKTQQYDRPVGVSATGAYGHEVAQAGAVGRAGDNLIHELGDPSNREILGQLSSYVKQGTLGTPLADRKAAYLSSELKTFSALQPAMHGFRARTSQQAFEKIVGGLAQNPDATIAAIQGILKTASAITGKESGNTPPPGAKVIQWNDVK